MLRKLLDAQLNFFGTRPSRPFVTPLYAKLSVWGYRSPLYVQTLGEWTPGLHVAGPHLAFSTRLT